VAILEKGTVEMGTQQQAYQILRVRLVDGPWAGQVGSTAASSASLNVRLTPGGHRSGDRRAAAGGVLTAYSWTTRGTPLPCWPRRFVFIVAVSARKGARTARDGLQPGRHRGLRLPRILRRRPGRQRDRRVPAARGDIVWLDAQDPGAAVLGTLLALVLTACSRGCSSAEPADRLRRRRALFWCGDQGTINLRGIVLGGMLIGALGVLDDLTIRPRRCSSSIGRISLDLRSLYRRGRVGQDRGATINRWCWLTPARPTLLLLFTLPAEREHLARSEFITEEIAR
jgi:hypothetical protein